MRLHKLRMRAFGPFAHEQSVDFEPLGAGGLFLLDGPTGAGKSTVLDAITFALYGPGEGGGWGRLHSHFADPGVEPQVQLEFSLRAVRQRITRSPEYDRPKRRGDGTVRERAQVHLERWQDGRWVSRSSNKADVGEMLLLDLGLTREQFTQVVLLPQGEFMRFLRAGDDDRRSLLTKLFGTQLYDRITDELDRRRKLASVDVDEATARLRSRISAAAQAAGLDATGQDELAALNSAERGDRLDAIAATLTGTAESTAEAAAAAQAELHTAREHEQATVAKAELLRRCVRAGRLLAEHEQSRADHSGDAAVLDAAERAESVRPLLAAVDDAEAALCAAATQIPADAAHLPAAQFHKRGEELLQLAAELGHLVEREATQSEQRAALRSARRTLAAATVQAEELAGRAAALPDELDAVCAEVESARRAADTIDMHVERERQLRAQLDALHALAELAPRHDAAVATHDAAARRYFAAADRYVELADARLANMAAELAGTLADGAPCPVCGSDSHPEPAVGSADRVDAPAVAKALAQRRTAESERDDAAAAVAEFDVRRAALMERAGDGDATAIRAELPAVQRRIRAGHEALSRLEGLVQTRARLEGESATLAAGQRETAAQLAGARAAADTAEAAVADLDAALAEAAAGYPSVAANQQALRRQAAQAQEVARALAVLAELRTASAQARIRALAEAESRGFADLDAARAAIQPRARIDDLRASVARWESELAALRAAASADEFGGLDIATAPAIELAAREAAVVAAAADARARTSGVAAERARETAAQFANARSDVERAAGELHRLDEVAGPVMHLARLAKGVSGQRRVTLTTYVLRQWFEQVVAAANVRLHGMSSGRYELLRVDEGMTRAERTGLTVQVLDRHTGEQRNPRSLSGGETFYTSLALALGLADVVRGEAGGVDLDTLFIDEGFGSLDPDTLDQVMGVIDELRDRGRTVGIVSHVSELKERIAERIEVRRLADGSSALRVVA